MKPISRDAAWVLAFLVPFGTGMVFHKYVLGVVNVQALNMEIAEENLPRARTMLGADVRFKDITPYVYTGQGGALGVHGTVETDEDLCKLMKTVAAEQLPVTVHWNVKVESRQKE